MPASVVLVEGVSDQLVVEALAARRGRDRLGAAEVERIVEAEGELGRLRTFQNQPAQRARSLDAQLRRFMGTRGGRKIQYAPVFGGALDLARVPRPLDGVLAHG
jgi:hypothetical protein